MIEAKFSPKGIPTPMLYQPMYKLIILLAILLYGANRKATNFLKLHLYMWGIRNRENLEVLKEIKTGLRLQLPPWSFEPGLEKIITLCIINNYCIKEMKGDQLKIKISAEGMTLLYKVEMLGLFSEDIASIKSVGLIAQDKLSRTNENWSIK